MTTGPIPKRSEERRRRNKTTETGVPIETEKVEVDEEAPPPLPMHDHWHDDAKEFYRACVDSIQSRFYEPSDWAVLKMACETQSRLLKPQPIKVADGEGGERIEMMVMPIKGADLNALTRAWASLLVTDGDRRRLRLETIRKTTEPQAPASAADIVQNRAGLFAVPGGA